MEGAFDTGPYLNVIECFVAEGPLLIFTCTQKNSQRWKTPAEGACESRGSGLGGRRRLLAGRKRGFHVQPRRSSLVTPLFFFSLSYRSGLSSPKERELLLLYQTVGWLEGWGGDETALNEKEVESRKAGRSRRGTSPGGEERMTVEGFRGFIHGRRAVMSEWCDRV